MCPLYQSTIATSDQMEALGCALAKSLIKHKTPEIVIYLTGNLGAGKTTFVRGFLRGLQYLGNVKSPTYTLVEPYDLAVGKVYHFDFYRLNNSQELEYMGIREYFHQAYCLLEWPEKAQGFLPEADLALEISIKDDARGIVIAALSDRGKDALQTLKGK